MQSFVTIPKRLTAMKFDLNKKHMRVEKVGKDYELNDFTCKTCEFLNCTSCFFKGMVQNPKGLRCIKESASSFLKFLHCKVLFCVMWGLTVPPTTLLCSSLVILWWGIQGAQPSTFFLLSCIAVIFLRGSAQ